MKTEQKLKYLRDRREARRMYRETNMSVSQIARLLRLSTTKVNNMIDGKREPIWFTEGDYP